MTKKEIKELINDGFEPGAIEAYISIVGEEYAEKEGFEESYQGHFDNDEAFVMELLTSCGDIPEEMPTYIHIDWESTARDVMMDYSEENGYYFRL